MTTEPRVVLTRRAQKDLPKLESGAAKRILRRLKEVGVIPVPGIGDIRVIFDVDGSTGRADASPYAL